MKTTTYPAEYYGRIILAGNPNVGKSTLFNHLTGKKVHTGNWSGKTVSISQGEFLHNNKRYLLEDLPGISSLSSPDAEELSAFKSIISGDYDCCIIMADATNLKRSMALIVRILELSSRCVVCINLYDQAKKRGIAIDAAALSFILGVPVVLTSVQQKTGITSLVSACESIISGNISPIVFTPLYEPQTENALSSYPFTRSETLSKLYFMTDAHSLSLRHDISVKISALSDTITKLVISRSKKATADKVLDKVFCSPYLGIPVMMLLLGLVLFITIVLSNYPSSFLSALFDKGKVFLSSLFSALHVPGFITGFFIHGVYTTTATVVSVMLPPMAIFFPLFTLLEDFGYLPRMAFNLDNVFRKCGSCGKQALCMCMGLGCNCVGIANSAIIPSKKEKLISIITNTFTPCNGRFGAIIATITIFFSRSDLTSAFYMVLTLAFSLIATLLASFILSKTVLRGEKSVFILEMPSYRKPPILKSIASSFSEQVGHILLRAVSIAAPMGGLIYAANYFSLLSPVADFLNPLASLMGLDGIILLSFILAFPANEIVFPLMLMLYTDSLLLPAVPSTLSLGAILIQNGWTVSTAVCFLIFTLLHFPCASALSTAYHETHSIKWTVAAFIIPTAFGIAACIIFSNFFGA